MSLEVLKKHKYVSGMDTWFEYQFKYLGRKFYLEIEDKWSFLSFSELNITDINIATDKFLSNSPSHEISFGNKVFPLDEEGSAIFYKNGDDLKQEKFVYYDYLLENELITVEVWDDDSIEVHTSFRFSTSQIN